MYHFFAYMARLKLIKRWGLMRNTTSENTQEHSLQVAQIAHILALIHNKYSDLPKVDANKIAVLALYHDAPEVITGDLATPVKYCSDEMINSYAALENEATERLISYLPEEFQADYEAILDPESGLETRLLKAADKICAYLKCVEEIEAGNNEFALAKSTTYKSLKQFDDLIAVDYFLQNFAPSFKLTLDELSK